MPSDGRQGHDVALAEADIVIMVIVAWGRAVQRFKLIDGESNFWDDDGGFNWVRLFFA